MTHMEMKIFELKILLSVCTSGLTRLNVSSFLLDIFGLHLFMNLSDRFLMHLGKAKVVHYPFYLCWLYSCCYDFDQFRLYSRDRIQSVSDNAQASVQGAS